MINSLDEIQSDLEKEFVIFTELFNGYFAPEKYSIHSPDLDERIAAECFLRDYPSIVTMLNIAFDYHIAAKKAVDALILENKCA